MESTVEERPDGTTYRIIYTKNTTLRLERRTRWEPLLKYALRALVFLIILIIAIVIGLIAVGPEGVWEEIKDLLPNLFESAVLAVAV